MNKHMVIYHNLGKCQRHGMEFEGFHQIIEHRKVYHPDNVFKDKDQKDRYLLWREIVPKPRSIPKATIQDKKHVVKNKLKKNRKTKLLAVRKSPRLRAGRSQ